MKYHAVNYNLFTNNCNHFTDVVIDFYVAKFRGQDIKVARHGVKHTNGQLLQQMLGQNFV